MVWRLAESEVTILNPSGNMINQLLRKKLNEG